MDTRRLLEDLIQSSKDIAAKGGDIAEKKLDIPEAGPERDAMLKGLGKGAAAAGALALLVGTSGGRRLTGTVLKLGSLAAIGGVGYTAYKNWQNKQSGDVAEPRRELFSVDTDNDGDDRRSRMMIRSMIAAAKADGHIDEAEKANIESGLAQLDMDSDLSAFLAEEVAKPLQVDDVVQGVDSMEAATEVWLASRMVIDANNRSEREYLDNLAKALGLSGDLVDSLESELNTA